MIEIKYVNSKKEYKTGLSNFDYLNMIEVKIKRNDNDIVSEYYYYFSLEG